MYRAIVQAELQSADLSIEESIQEKLVQYCELVSYWNRRVNLTGLDGVNLVRRLVVEPIWIAQQFGIEGRLVDIGSGNGSPAIPICLTRPVTSAELVEVRTRRVAFLRQVVVELRMPCVRVIKGRFEAMASSIEPTDWITMQAVAPESLAKALRALLSPTTTVVWITSHRAAVFGMAVKRRLKVPFTSTEALALGQARCEKFE